MPAAKFQIERKCELCGKTFLAKTITSRYCSIQCSRSAYSQKKREEKLEELRRERAAKVPKDHPYLSISDAIALYDVCRDTLYRLVRSKALRSYNLGKRMRRICREDLERNFNLRPTDEQKPKTRSEIVSILKWHCKCKIFLSLTPSSKPISSELKEDFPSKKLFKL